MFDRYWLRKLLLVVIIAAIVPPIIWGEPRLIEGQSGGQAWRNVIFDFQTLIGGLLAIFAAWWTVDTMERTDKAAEERHYQNIKESQAAELSAQRRHTELVQLSLRGEKLKVHRVIRPQRYELQALERQADNLANTARRIVQGEQNLWRQWAVATRSLFVDLEDVLNRPQFMGAEDLFDGNLAYIVWKLRRGMEGKLRLMDAGCFYATRSLTSEEEADFTGWKERGGQGQMMEFVYLCAGGLTDFVRALDKMGELYELAVD